MQTLQLDEHNNLVLEDGSLTVILTGFLLALKT